MSVCLSRGVMTISIDLDLDVTRIGLAKQRSLDEMTSRLIQLMGKYELPATWAVADPAVSAATERIRTNLSGHEMAILGDATWVGREAGRGRFGRELTRRVVRGRGTGVCITTLILKTAALDEHCDLAIKQGIHAVRQPASEEVVGGGGYTPHTLRFGLWNFPVSAALPGGSRWLPGGGAGRGTRLGIDEAIAAHRLFQLHIDAPALIDRGNAAQHVLERVLQHAHRRRQQGVLEVATLGATAQKLSKQARSQPSRSILRVA